MAPFVESLPSIRETLGLSYPITLVKLGVVVHSTHAQQGGNRIKPLRFSSAMFQIWGQPRIHGALS